MTTISLPNETGQIQPYNLTGIPIAPVALSPTASRVIYSAAHVVANP